MKTLKPFYDVQCDGCITITGQNIHETWRPWGHSEGFGVAGCEQDSESGESNPLLLGHVFKPDYKGVLAPIRDSVPVEVRNATLELGFYLVELLQLAECNPRHFCYLQKTNPALLVLMAAEISESECLPVSHWGNLLGLKQGKIMRCMGYPSQWAALLRKLDEPLLYIQYLRQFFSMLQRIKGASRLLAHVSQINFDINGLLVRYPELCLANPSLLHCASQSEDGAVPTLDAVTQIMWSRAMQNREPLWPYRDTLTPELLQLYEARSLSKNPTAFHSIAYSNPPVEPDIDWGWVGSKSELKWFGEKWKNCALSKHPQCAMGLMAIYYERGGGPDSVCVVLQRGGTGWRVSDVLGSHNALVEPAKKLAVELRFTELANSEKEVAV